MEKLIELKNRYIAIVHKIMLDRGKETDNIFIANGISTRRGIRGKKLT